MIPDWAVTSSVVVATSVASFVAFKVSVLKDIAHDKETLARHEDNIAKLFDKSNGVERRKAETADMQEFRAEIRNSLTEIKTDFRSFREDVTGEFRQLRQDVSDSLREAKILL